MDRRLAFLTGGVAVALAAAWRTVRRGRSGWGAEEPAPDTRAAELRQRLDEARAVVDERDEFDGAEATVDEIDVVPPADPDERRRAVHAEARSAVDRMRASDTEG